MEKCKKRKKRVVFEARPYDIEAIEQFLGEKVANGWMFVKRTGNIYVFEECEPTKMQFKVDFYKKGSKLRNEEEDSSMFQYIEYFKNYGWQHIYSSGKVQILCATEGTPWPIQEDEKSKLRMAKKIVSYESLLLHMQYSVFLGIFILYGLYVSLFHPLDYQSYADGIAGGTMFGLALLWFVCFIYTFVCAVRFGIFVMGNKRRIKSGLSIRYYSAKNVKRFGIFSEVVDALSLGLILLAVSEFSSMMIKVILCTVLLVVGGSLLVNKLFRDKELHTLLTYFTATSFLICLVSAIAIHYIYPYFTEENTKKTNQSLTSSSIHTYTDYESMRSPFGKLERISYVVGDDTEWYHLIVFTSGFSSIMETYNDLLLTDESSRLSKVSNADNSWNTNLVYKGTKEEWNRYVVIGEGITLVVNGQIDDAQVAVLTSEYLK